MTRLAALVALLVLVAGCTGSEEPADGGPAPTTAVPSGRPAPAVALVPFDNKTMGRGTNLSGCGSIGATEEAYVTPVLIWVRLRVAEKVRLLPASYAERSNDIDSVTQYLGPDPGRRAPHLAVSVGNGPTADRLTYDTNLIGDARHSSAGLEAARASWQARVPLDRGRPVGPGDHYLFVEVDPAKGGMDLHTLAARWTHDGIERHRVIGGLSLRVLCGG